MKKIGAIVFLLIFVLVGFVDADNITYESQIDDAFACLEEDVGSCTLLSIEEIAFTIMATPDNVFDDCVRELKAKESNNNWGSVKETALAILALDHAGENTTAYENWLLEQEQVPTDLSWYIQQDSNGETSCNIRYTADDYDVIIGENKEINSGAGLCLSLSGDGNFWFKVNSACYGETFTIQCDKKFIINLLYKSEDSLIGTPTYYVLEGTHEIEPLKSTDVSVMSKCFGGADCEYEGTLWATLALYKTKHNIDDYLPYIISMAENNNEYLPKAFIYMLTNYNDYAGQLASKQKLGYYWDVGSYNGKYYDTALALIALGSSNTEQITLAKDWLLFVQGDDGCWGNSLNTAIILWALENRGGKTSSSTGSSSVVNCAEAGYFCMPKTECVIGEDVSDNYFCKLPGTCCTDSNLKNCAEYGGQKCETGSYCENGINRNSLDVPDKCCTGTCVLGSKEEENECEDNDYNCYNVCGNGQEELDYSCGASEKVCCTDKVLEEKKSLWWLWLILGLVLVLGAVAFIFRDKLQQKLDEFKKKKGGKTSSPPNGFRPGMPPRGPPTRPGMPPRGLPPRPGFPPVVRPQTQMRPGMGNKEDPAMRETFRKLRQIAAR